MHDVISMGYVDKIVACPNAPINSPKQWLKHPSVRHPEESVLETPQDLKDTSVEIVSPIEGAK